MCSRVFSQDGLPIGTDGRYYFQAGAICLPGKSVHSQLSVLIWKFYRTRNDIFPQTQDSGECRIKSAYHWMIFIFWGMYHNVRCFVCVCVCDAMNWCFIWLTCCGPRVRLARTAMLPVDAVI